MTDCVCTRLPTANDTPVSKTTPSTCCLVVLKNMFFFAHVAITNGTNNSSGTELSESQGDAIILCRPCPLCASIAVDVCRRMRSDPPVCRADDNSQPSIVRRVCTDLIVCNRVIPMTKHLPVRVWTRHFDLRGEEGFAHGDDRSAE